MDKEKAIIRPTLESVNGVKIYYGIFHNGQSIRALKKEDLIEIKNAIEDYIELYSNTKSI